RRGACGAATSGTGAGGAAATAAVGAAAAAGEGGAAPAPLGAVALPAVGAGGLGVTSSAGLTLATPSSGPREARKNTSPKPAAPASATPAAAMTQRETLGVARPMSAALCSAWGSVWVVGVAWARAVALTCGAGPEGADGARAG